MESTWLVFSIACAPQSLTFNAREIIMRRLHYVFLVQITVLVLYSTNALSHDDLAAREKEFRYGYQVGYITAIRESLEGALMCTKDIPLLEVIQILGAYNKIKGIPLDQTLSVKNITEALSNKYKCRAK